VCCMVPDQFAIDASLDPEDWDGAERYSAALEDYTQPEPLTLGPTSSSDIDARLVHIVAATPDRRRPASLPTWWPRPSALASARRLGPCATAPET
jgi:hypothetical protein